MQVTSASSTAAPSTSTRELMTGAPGGTAASGSDPRFAQYKVIRRNGAVVGFESDKIAIAMTKAFLAVTGGQGAASARVREQVTKLTEAVVAALMKRKPEGGAIHIEEIQDQVELALMRGGEHEVARAYVLYRERRSQERAHEKSQKRGKTEATAITVVENGVSKPLDLERLTALVKESCEGLGGVEPERSPSAPLSAASEGQKHCRKTATNEQPFVGWRLGGQLGAYAVEQAWICRKHPANGLFLLCFSLPVRWMK